MITYHYAATNDYEYLKEKDRHVSAEMLERKIKYKEVIVAKDGDQIVGWLRFGYFWNVVPYMNLIHVLDSYRGLDVGTNLGTYWENEMRSKGHQMVLTSTMAVETSQQFYRKCRYVDVGGFLLEKEGLEIMFKKNLNE
nr:GNAT family N-acetyltransferase [Anaerobacillus isosaccharinicus]